MNGSGLKQGGMVSRLPRVLLVLLLLAMMFVLLLCGLDGGSWAGPIIQSGVTLVPNPGFETPSPAHWENPGSSPPSGGYIWSGSEYHGGSHSVEIWSTSWLTGQWWCDPFNVVAGLPYTFSGWIKANGLSDRAFLTLAFYSSPSKEDLIKEFSSSQVSGSSNWTKATTSSIIAPDGAQYARVYCELAGRGTAWFDDVAVRRVGTVSLTISKSDIPDPVRPGQSLVYVIVYSNTGTTAASGLVITDILPVSVSYKSASVIPTTFFSAANTLVWDSLDSLGSGSKETIIITTTVNDGPTLLNLAQIAHNKTGAVTTTAVTRVKVVSGDMYLPLVLKNSRTGLCNGGFETGDFTCWTHGGKLDQSIGCGTAVGYEGYCTALLGSPDYPCKNGVPIGEAWMSQAFSVPSCLSPTLLFKYRILSNDKLTGDKWDSFDVYINGTLIVRDGNTDWEKATCTRTPWDSGWKGFFYDLSAYKGQNIQLSFHNVNKVDQWFGTWTYVDQVEVTCKP